MTTVCKYCDAQNLEWKQTLEGAWVLLAADGFRHHCTERRVPLEAEREPPKKKAKSGAFLRLYGPRSARTHAMLVPPTPQHDTPASFYHELTSSPAEKVQPWGTSRWDSARYRK